MYLKTFLIYSKLKLLICKIKKLSILQFFLTLNALSLHKSMVQRIQIFQKIDPILLSNVSMPSADCRISLYGIIYVSRLSYYKWAFLHFHLFICPHSYHICLTSPMIFLIQWKYFLSYEDLLLKATLFSRWNFHLCPVSPFIQILFHFFLTSSTRSLGRCRLNDFPSLSFPQFLRSRCSLS